jgi:adenosylcobinamide-GDP ribazoletransferase
MKADVLMRWTAMMKVFSNVPVPRKLNEKSLHGLRPDHITSSMYFLPVVGLAIGAICLALDWLLLSVNIPPLVAGAVTLSVLTLLSGTAHIEGAVRTIVWLVESGEADPPRYSGKGESVGMAEIACLILVIIVELSAIVDLQSTEYMVFLVLMPVYSRVSLLIASYGASPIDDDGMGTLVTGSVTRRQLLIGIGIACVISSVSICVLLLLLICGLVAAGLRMRFAKTAGGMTTHMAMGVVALSDVVFLMSAVFFKQFIF